jgi:uncharacterized protein YqhQ
MKESGKNKRIGTGVGTSFLFIILIVVMLLCLFFQRKAVLENFPPRVRGGFATYFVDFRRNFT